MRVRGKKQAIIIKKFSSPQPMDRKKFWAVCVVFPRNFWRWHLPHMLLCLAAAGGRPQQGLEAPEKR